MKANQEIEIGVMSIVNRFAEAFTRRDLEAMMALYVLDPDVVVIGTGGDEKRVGLADIKSLFKRDFTQFEDASLEVGWYIVSAADPVAWVTADAIVRADTGGREIDLPVRLTFVLEQRGDRWLIAQFHASTPAAGQEEGEAFPT